MKIIAFGASSSKNSINKNVAIYAASLFEKAQVEVLDLNDFEMPLFSVDTEQQIGQHPLAQSFLDSIASADVLVVSLAEHNGNYAAAFKNILDWCTRITPKVFHGKPMLLMAASPGGRGGATVLEIATNAFARFGAEIKETFLLPNYYSNFDGLKMQLSDPELDTELKTKVQRF
ncbi:NADPH-dependent FMN reductase [Flavobacterium crassostreae]|uniref:NADPH-dependent FMN reductase n=1 Tax=Flavobacterium crassostreae TaxID=1763534 RepID=A0A1B9E9U2_9FLAO|nr:NAD(P)H-dependent oxidoreductase [Flavobacterium crassostreae]OCB78730.1 NADPH-dependent FMN reductase [Flavobacterium crassostreae]